MNKQELQNKRVEVFTCAVTGEEFVSSPVTTFYYNCNSTNVDDYWFIIGVNKHGEEVMRFPIQHTTKICI